MILQDLVQIVTSDFKSELRKENHWLLFAPIPVLIKQSHIQMSLQKVHRYDTAYTRRRDLQPLKQTGRRDPKTRFAKQNLLNVSYRRVYRFVSSE